MLKLHKMKHQIFECKIDIEGADKSTAKPRLILYPDGDSRNIFFEGKIENGICKINVYPNINSNNKGKAVLEVIVENSMVFQPWTSDFEIIQKNNVKMNENSVPKISILNENVKTNKKKSEKSFDLLLEEAANMVVEKQNKNKKLIKIYTESIKSLPKQDLSNMVSFVKTKYRPTDETKQWAKKFLKESKSVKSKLLMYCNEIKK